MTSFEAFSWFEFMAIAIIVAVFSLSVLWMRNYARNHHLPMAAILNRLADWTPFISTVTVLVLFVALNPITHFVIVASLIFLCYGVFRNILLGLPLRPLYRTLQGKWVSVAHHEGVMMSFDRKGIYLAQDDTKSYIPNSKVHQNGIQALQYNLPVSLRLVCSISMDSPEKSLPFSKIMDRIMAMPYTIDKVNVKPVGNTLLIDAKLISDKYAIRFIKALEELNINVNHQSKNQ